MMDILQDAMIKDERLLNINPHYNEFGVINHPYVRLSSAEIFPIFLLQFIQHLKDLGYKNHM